MHTSVKHAAPRFILVVGGAGYIGSHMVLALQSAGYTPVILDNLCKGRHNLITDAKLVVGDMADKVLLNELFTAYRFVAVMHFASFIEVAESVQLPAKYYHNNVLATLHLLEAMRNHDVSHFIFSSSAAVYGNPTYSPVDELHPLLPINPYGRSKRMVEEIIQDYAQSAGLRYVILRYFNAAGADPKARVGESHDPESHLVPLLLQVALGKKANITVFGRDYPTIDGTCIRDYVHVSDLCVGHLQALNALLAGQQNKIYNLGNGRGYSVQQVIDAVQHFTKKPITVFDGNRRAGDPAVLVADNKRVSSELGWKPQFDLDTIIKHAWHFMQHRFSLP